MADHQLPPALVFSAAPYLHWVATSGYPAFIGLVLLAAAGAPLPVAALLIGLGVLSAQGQGPDLFLLAVLGTLAAVGGDVFDYWLGRLGSRVVGKWLAALLRRLMRQRARTLAQTHSWQGSGTAIFVTRFLLPWLGTPISLLAGSRRVAFALFLAWDIGGETMYVVGNLALGRCASGWLAQSWFGATFWGLVALVTLLPVLLMLGRWLRTRRKPDV
jgi:membrane-associated protein